MVHHAEAWRKEFESCYGSQRLLRTYWVNVANTAPTAYPGSESYLQLCFINLWDIRLVLCAFSLQHTGHQTTEPLRGVAFSLVALPLRSVALIGRTSRYPTVWNSIELGWLGQRISPGRCLGNVWAGYAGCLFRIPWVGLDKQGADYGGSATRIGADADISSHIKITPGTLSFQSNSLPVSIHSHFSSLERATSIVTWIRTSDFQHLDYPVFLGRILDGIFLPHCPLYPIALQQGSTIV